MNKVINGRTYTHQTQHTPPKYVRIVCEDAVDSNYRVLALILDDEGFEEVESYTKDLKYTIRKYSDYDLIPINPYADFKTDDLVAVKQSEKDSETVRYFSHVNELWRLHCFDDGGTSFTTSETVSWNFVRKITEEEAREILNSNEVRK